VIGKNVYIGKWCTVQCNGRIGDNTIIANNVGIVGKRDHATDRVGVPIREQNWVGSRKQWDGDDIVTIGRDCWLGFGCVVLSGVSIGNGGIVAAGAVVTHNVPPHAVVAGNPARVVGSRFSVAEALEHERLLDAVE